MLGTRYSVATATTRAPLLPKHGLDPQESLASWWTRRGRTRNPKLHEVDATTEAIEMLIAEGWEWVFIDTGPAKIDLIEPGIVVADLVITPRGRRRYQQAYMAALTVGKSGPEVDKEGDARAEIEALSPHPTAGASRRAALRAGSST